MHRLKWPCPAEGQGVAQARPGPLPQRGPTMHGRTPRGVWKCRYHRPVTFRTSLEHSASLRSTCAGPQITRPMRCGNGRCGGLAPHPKPYGHLGEAPACARCRPFVRRRARTSCPPAGPISKRRTGLASHMKRWVQGAKTMRRPGIASYDGCGPPQPTSPLRPMSIPAVSGGISRADKRPETVIHGFRAAREIRKMAIDQRKLPVGLVRAHSLPGKTVERRD